MGRAPRPEGRSPASRLPGVALRDAVQKRSETTVGVTALIRRIEASELPLGVLEGAFRHRWSSPDGADEVT